MVPQSTSAGPTDQRARDILRQVRQVEIRTRKFIDESLVGAYHSVFKGRGMDFAEVREYQPGDDVRTIDWNVTARMDQPFVKVYEEERELTVLLAVDLSASGDFGSTGSSKRERAAELASVLAFSATRNNDKVGLLLFTNEIELYIPPKKGRQHVLRVIREILFFEPQNRGTDLTGALRQLNHLVRRKAIVFFLSDFLTDSTLSWIRPSTTESPDELEKMIRTTGRRHDFIGIQLEDPRELELPDVGWIVLEDAETGAICEIDTSHATTRQLYRHRNEERRDALERLFRKSGLDLFRVTTNEPFMQTLRNFFARREARRR